MNTDDKKQSQPPASDDELLPSVNDVMVAARVAATALLVDDDELIGKTSSALESLVSRLHAAATDRVVPTHDDTTCMHLMEAALLSAQLVEAETARDAALAAEAVSHRVYKAMEASARVVPGEVSEAERQAEREWRNKLAPTFANDVGEAFAANDFDKAEERMKDALLLAADNARQRIAAAVRPVEPATKEKP